jgi:ketosteroid isomerase-like protein
LRPRSRTLRIACKGGFRIEKADQPGSRGMKTDQGSVESFLTDVRTARIAGDVEALMGHFAEDATFRIAGAGAPAVGKDAIRDALAGLVEEFQYLEWNPTNVFVAGDELSIRSHVKMRHKSGRVIETETSDFATLKDGKLSSYVQYVDTALLFELKGL